MNDQSTNSINIPTVLKKNTWQYEYQKNLGISAPIPQKIVNGLKIPVPLFVMCNMDTAHLNDINRLIALGITHVDYLTVDRNEPLAISALTYSYVPNQGTLTTQQAVNAWVDAHIPIQKDHVYTTQLQEGGMGNEQTEDWACERIYNNVRSTDTTNIITPADTNCFGPYGQDSFHRFELDFGLSGNSFRLNQGRNALSNQTEARKIFADGALTNTHPYWSQGKNAYRNRVIKFYPRTDLYTYNSFPYFLIANFEKWNISDNPASPRKTLLFMWSQYEPHADPGQEDMDHSVRKSAVRFNNPAGDLLFHTPGMQMSFSTGVDCGFISSIWGNGVYMWDFGPGGYSSSINDFDLGFNTPIEWKLDSAGKTQWTTAPQPKPTRTIPASSPRQPHSARHQSVAESGVYAGRLLASRIRDRNDQIRYGRFSYTIDGGSSSIGYKNADTPISGANGTHISNYGRGNAGNHSIIDTWDMLRPIFIEGNGSAGRFAAMRNPQAQMHQTTTYAGYVNNILHTMESKGSGWSIYIFNANGNPESISPPIVPPPINNSRTMFFGLTTPNDAQSDGVDRMNIGHGMGFNTNGVVFPVADVATDAKWNMSNWQPFNHKVTPTSIASFQWHSENAGHQFDITLHEHWKKGQICRLIIPIARPWNMLRGTAGVTNFAYTSAAAHMRPDGSTPTFRERLDPGPKPFAPSPSHPDVIEYAKQLYFRVCNRYQQAIIDGTLFVGYSIDDQAEGQMPFYFRGQAGEMEADFNVRGDFNNAAITKFKAMFPMYNSLTNNNIQAAYPPTELRMRFDYFENKTLALLDHTVLSFVASQVPALAPIRFGFFDAGGMADALSDRRRTFMAQHRANHPNMRFVKSNDRQWSYYSIDFSWSAAKRAGAGVSYIQEPTPDGHLFTQYADEIRASVIRSIAAGTSISFLGGSAQDHIAIQGIAQQSGILPLVLAPSTNNFGEGFINLSDILKQGHTHVQNRWNEIRSTTSKEYVYFNVVDDINP